MNYQTIAFLISSLAIFFYSIQLLGKHLRESLNQRTQGIIKRISSNALLMFATGIILSFLLHSSSALIALVIIMAGTNCISLKGALNITLGANIGTTLTAFFIIIDFTYALPFIFIIALILNAKKKNAGTFLFAFGLLYFSLDLFSNSLSTLAQEQALLILLKSLDSNPIFALFLGALVVLVMQSSTLFLSMLKAFSQAGSVGVKGLIGLILGANIGTTGDAFLLARNKKGLHIAIFNLVFNIIGALLFLIIIVPFSNFINRLQVNNAALPVLIHFIYNLITSIIGFIIVNSLYRNILY